MVRYYWSIWWRRDITGQFGGGLEGGEHGVGVFGHVTGCFKGLAEYDSLGQAKANSKGLKSHPTVEYSNSYVSPKQNENTPIESNILAIYRIA